ncbi:S-adenosyl-L-methionine-dependent methyltransferases superfamily protein [Quillaja saponaria]|uniref:S-adenosyl-L-methionine-dependent methyltransferases superfamily protein n=1 Tax=Quillaja saponaria TaxID=32244 RepID=A0AAD7QIK6_QUISA|nr:S-adenosyl-L-methionine-dependent methyltransferases superfamily protein [Quillaja saponaria]
MLSLRFWLGSLSIQKPITSSSRRLLASSQKNGSWNNPRSFCCCVKAIKNNDFISESNSNFPLSSSPPRDSPLSGVEDTLISYVSGKKKATEVAHQVWKQVVQRGDTVVDATCGNGFDTLAMLKLVADDSGKGRVYGMDIQKDALDKTSTLLEESHCLNEKQYLKLFHICHSKMDEVVPLDASVRLVAFNLGYLPGGDKEIVTRSETTLLALEAAKRIIIPGGLISIVVYVGHPGGWDELEAIQAFTSTMTVDNWICCKLQMLNRPCAPIPIFLFRR